MLRLLVRPASIACVVLAAAAVLVWNAGAPASSAAVPVAASAPAAPTRLGEWAGREMPLDQRVFDILETHDVIAAEYQRGTEPVVWFAQVSGFGNRTAFHPPEICLTGSHFEILERGPIVLSMAGHPRQVMRLVISQGGQRYEAWYWFTANGRVTSNYYRQQWWLLTDAVRGRPLAGTLVRISTPLDDATAARQRLMAFMAQLEQASPGTAH